VYAGAEPTLVEALHADAGGTCGGKPCWKQRDSRSFLFKDHTGSQTGLKRIVLRFGRPSLADLVVRARGPNVPLPVLPLSEPVVAQLVRSDNSACWESDYSAPPVRNRSTVFSDRND
jgi:hypothetical protein